MIKIYKIIIIVIAISISKLSIASSCIEFTENDMIFSEKTGDCAGYSLETYNKKESNFNMIVQGGGKGGYSIQFTFDRDEVVPDVENTMFSFHDNMSSAAGSDSVMRAAITSNNEFLYQHGASEVLITLPDDINLLNPHAIFISYYEKQKKLIINIEGQEMTTDDVEPISGVSVRKVIIGHNYVGKLGMLVGYATKISMTDRSAIIQTLAEDINVEVTELLTIDGILQSTSDSLVDASIKYDPQCYNLPVGTVADAALVGCGGMLVVNRTMLNSAITDNTYSIDHNGETYTFKDDDYNIFTGQIINMYGLFWSGNLAFNEDIGYWDVSKVKNMAHMFRDASVFNKPLNDWDVGEVTDMRNMFYGARSFNQPLDEWDTSSVTTMYQMFKSAIVFNQPLDGWDVRGVENVMSMFNHATTFNQPLNSWELDGVNSMNRMFATATNFNQPLNNWKVGNVNNMGAMFYRARAFNQPLDEWDTSSVTTMYEMFREARAFNQPLNTWNVGKVKNMVNMFKDATSFNQSLADWCVRTLITYPEAPGGFGASYQDAILPTFNDSIPCIDR
jgi:surface protein